jgi:hypothetical protein
MLRHMEYMKQMASKLDNEEDTVKYLSGSKKEDMVNHPAHYNKAGIETIDAIGAATNEGFKYYLQGNILKYIWRYEYKNGVEDLEKAQWYLNKLIEVTNDKS